MVGYIHSTESFGTVDGPGVRTAVFLKGCNLDCFWCHNPEGKRVEAEYAYFEEKCLACGACRGENMTDGDRVAHCPAQARKCYGKPYTEDELFALYIEKRYDARTEPDEDTLLRIKDEMQIK